VNDAIAIASASAGRLLEKRACKMENAGHARFVWSPREWAAGAYWAIECRIREASIWCGMIRRDVRAADSVKYCTWIAGSA